MTDARTSKTAINVLSRPVPDVRVTKTAINVMVKAGTGPHLYWWDGAALQDVDRDRSGWWDGAAIQPIDWSRSGWWNGAAIDGLQ